MTGSEVCNSIKVEAWMDVENRYTPCCFGDNAFAVVNITVQN